ncbi:hypothetical protein AMIS_26590 [Actinoplanes missouriensis 431]|uniref:Uncharacterized protein n=1 Tax=Actinoplanes missouriensis (strain ATCC 14538 / DSM 43046 / CBS 188.64 / JCM 3121 / NBRC 102363 / NCIMB 12654 / NRRL B-3342 / UNCC 431) TaxID=512565 RepID=I0H4E2_ACTM4|nr:hypothetical protein AMIS_26590 [Actinoplanes missouriensis 431]
MVQAPTQVQRSGRDGSARGSGDGFRVGASHDAPVRTGSTTVPAGGRKLPPIEWPRTDYRKIMITDLTGAGKGIATAALVIAVLVAAGMGIAVAVTSILNALGFDPASLY